MSSFPERLFAAGITDLLPVIPPGAKLVPSSKIPQAAIGKIPGRRHASGLWAGLNWRILNATATDVTQWVADGANIGLRATNFPGVDIDVADPVLAKMIEDAVLGQLGFAPIRVGKPPKRLMMYALSGEPFSRMRLWIQTHDGSKHLVEILGEGQQYLVSGTHPSGKEYVWRQDPTERPLTPIDAVMANACLNYIAELIDVAGIGSTEREGDGKRSQRTASEDQTALLAPSLDVLREAVALIPNIDSQFHTRTDYLRFGYAIRAAAGAEHDDEGCEIFQEWAGRWDAGTNDPDTARADYRRMMPPYSVGWNFLAQLARPHGFVDAALEFDVSDEAPVVGDEDALPVDRSDQWLAEEIVNAYRGELRYVPQRGKWLVWSGAKWELDDMILAEAKILQGLRKIAARELRKGATGKEKAAAISWARTVCSAAKAASVAQIVRSDRAIAVSADALDHDPWLLNTPGGIVDLKTGTLGASNPDALATRMTRVAPDFTLASPEWDRYLHEATGRDVELQAYLQRLAGYALTGSTREQHLTFIWGPGGYGKGTFLHALEDVFDMYAITASMDSFTVGYGDKHTTDLAMMVGARLVTASEVTTGKKWDEQRVKSLTGGDRVTARFMRQDNFMYVPQFKLLFIGNSQPELREVDEAMRRRIHMVPFNTKPAQNDPDLKEKLIAEYPAILAWAVRGCLSWQEQGLNPPSIVRTSTEEYFESEDSYGQWSDECVRTDVAGAFTRTSDLFQSWQEWANPRKIAPGSMKQFSTKLGLRRGWVRGRDAKGTRGFVGVELISREGLGLMD